MSLFPHKGEAVERFLDALRCDPQAVPPPDLDPETAELIRAVVQLHALPDEASEPDMSLIEQRVWDRVMFGILAPPDVKPNYLPGEYDSKIITFPLVDGEQGVETAAEPDTVHAITLQAKSPNAPAVVKSQASQRLMMQQQKLRLSFVAAMVVAVFCLTGLLLEYDVMANDLRYSPYAPSQKIQTTITTNRDVSVQQNAVRYSRFQPSSTTWEPAGQIYPVAPDKSETVALNIPISPRKQFPDLMGQQQ